MHIRIRAIALALALACAPAAAQNVTGAFTYQGRLVADGVPANGNYTLVFHVYDAATGGTEVAPAVTATNVPVVNGLVTTTVDFGFLPASGRRRWLEIDVVPPRGGVPTKLAPRQEITAQYYALHALESEQSSTVGPDGVDSAAIRNGTVTDIDLATDTITQQSLAAGAVATPELAANAVTSAKIANGTILDEDIGAGAIFGVSIADSSIDGDHILANAVGPSELATNAVTNVDVANDAIGSAEIIDGSIAAADVAANAFWRAGGNAGTTPSNNFLGTSDGQGLRISAGGGVGINTASPQAQLHVAYNPGFVDDEVARFSRATGTDAIKMKVAIGVPKIEFTNADALGAGSIEFRHDSTLAQNYLDFNALGSGTSGFPGLRLYEGVSLAGFSTRLQLAPGGGSAIAEKPGGGSWSAPSDARLKHDIEPLVGALDRLLALRGVTYEYNDGGKNGYPAGTQIGFVAQEVQAVFPSWVDQGANGYLLVGPKGFEALAVEALRELRIEQQVEIESLRAQNAALESRLAALEAKSEHRHAR